MLAGQPRSRLSGGWRCTTSSSSGLLPATPLHPCATRRQHVRVSALLQKEPASSGGGADDSTARMRQRLGALLAPSLQRAETGDARASSGSAASSSSSSTSAKSASSSAAGSLAPAAAATAPLPSTDGATVWHFAYGANINQQTLLRRDVRPLSRDGAFVVDAGVRLVFKHRGGYATLERTPSPRFAPFVSNVHGVLYRVTAADMAKLSKAEGGYVEREFEVETYDGRRVLARAFVSGPLAALPAEVAPTEKYMRALREGARDQFLDPLHQAWLSGIETVSSAGLPREYFDTPSKFVAYGFLAVAALLVVGFFAQH